MWVIWYIFVVYNPSVLVANEVRKRTNQKTNQRVVEPVAKNMKPEKEARKRGERMRNIFPYGVKRGSFSQASEENE